MYDQNGAFSSELSLFSSSGSISGRATRQSQHLNTPLFKSTTGQKTFYYRAVKLWNERRSEIKISMTIWDFKRKLKGDLIHSFLL